MIRVHFYSRDDVHLYFTDMPCPPRQGEYVQFPSGNVSSVQSCRWELKLNDTDSLAHCVVSDPLRPA